MERITLNIIPKGITPVCHASQFDIGRVIRCDIMDNLQGYVFSDETVELRVCKPDNNIVTASVDVVSGDTFVLIETTEQMTACDGVNKCELRIMKGNVRIGSLNFDMKVEVDPLKDGIESETVIHNLESMVDGMVAEDVAEQYDSANVIFDEEPTENHGIGYTVTSEGIKTAIDNAFDYNNTASGSIVHIEDGADNIPVKSIVSEIVAIQDLHGYEHPWPAGGGENLLPAATAGTFTKSGVTVVSDGKGNYHFYGTATTSVEITIPIEEVTLPDTVFIHLMNRSVASQCALVLEYDGTQIFAPAMVVANRIMDISAAAGGKTINSLGFYINNGYTVDVTLSPMLCVDNTVRSFSPYSNICSITGFDSGDVSVCGINLFDGILEKGYISTTTGEDTPNASGNQWSCKNYIRVKPNTSLYMKLPNGYTTGTSNITVYYYDVNKNFIGYESNKGNTVIQIPSNCHWFRFCNYIVTAIQDAPTGNSLNYPSSDTEYHAYNGNTYTFAFDQTVYVGHFDNKGNLVSTHKIVDFGDLGYYYSNGRFSSTDIPDVKNVSVWNSALKMCSCYEIAEVQIWTQGDSIIGLYGKNIYVKDSRYTDTTSFKQALTGQKFVVELANPIVLPITSQDIPTILGENNIFSNCGDVEVTYYTNKANDILDFVNSEIGKKNGTNIPIEENSHDSIKDYVDNEVSGINATNLPISSSDTTTTKDYIDNDVSGLSNRIGKFDTWKTSTTSFTDACASLGIYSAIGAVLDVLKDNVSGYADMSINNRVDNRQGPAYGMIVFKANDNYFSGILLSYFASASERQPIMFIYENGTYAVKRI